MSHPERLVVERAVPLPSGPGVSVTPQCLVRDGVALFPVSGEMHFSRIPRARWKDALQRARAGGLTHVATYTLWNHHEPVRGEYDFSGDLDVRAFVDEAVRAGLEVILRIGPYAHAEARHGGLPDWLVESGLPVRTNDPAYLAEATRWYARLARELDGAALFSLQADNELYDRPEHLTELRRIAESLGLGAPLWTATAWGGAELPEGFLPVFGGYPESFWIDADVEVDARSHSNFYPSARRDDDSIGADHRGDAAAAAKDTSRFPFATCELGGGMASAYHRRLDVPAADVEALAMAKLASGSVWQGYYMYADGRNPRPGLQESHATGSPNDFLDLGYDFGAPLTVDARPRESWFRLRRQHALLARWGAALATMPAVFPADAAEHPDVTRLRWSVRSDGATGFVFVVNRHPGLALPAHADVRFTIATPDGPVDFPAVDVPSGAVFAWPFGLPLGGALVRWLTAQPVTEVTWRGRPLLVATATEGIAAALASDHDVAEVAPVGRGRWFELSADGVVAARVVVFPAADADALAAVDGRIVFAPGAIVAGDGGDAFGAATEAEVLDDDGWTPLPVRRGRSAALAAQELRAPGRPPAPRSAASGRASVPVDWASAAVIRVPVDPADPRTVVVEWTGDAARAFDGDRLMADALWNGRAWRIPAEARGAAEALRLEILPLADDAPVHVPGPRPAGAAVSAVRYDA